MSQKMDISISKSSVLSVGDMSHIKPTVTVTVKDIDRENFDTEYKNLTEAGEAAMALEVVRQTNELLGVKNIGAKRFAENIDLEKVERKLSEFSKLFEIE